MSCLMSRENESGQLYNLFVSTHTRTHTLYFSPQCLRDVSSFNVDTRAGGGNRLKLRSTGKLMLLLSLSLSLHPEMRSASAHVSIRGTERALVFCHLKSIYGLVCVCPFKCPLSFHK